MLGYCMECKKLTPIRQVRSRWGAQMDYFPLPHDEPRVSDDAPPKRCDGHERAIR